MEIGRGPRRCKTAPPTAVATRRAPVATPRAPGDNPPTAVGNNHCVN